MKLHQGLDSKKWFEKSIVEQLANVGSEIERALDFKKQNDEERSLQALYRGFELLAYTIDDPKNKNRLKELCRLYEAVGEYFLGDNLFELTESWIRKYFQYFFLAYAAERERQQREN